VRTFILYVIFKDAKQVLIKFLKKQDFADAQERIRERSDVHGLAGGPNSRYAPISARQGESNLRSHFLFLKLLSNISL